MKNTTTGTTPLRWARLARLGEVGEGVEQALDLLRLEQRMQHVISTDSCSQVPKALHLSVTMPSVLLLGDDEVHYSDGAHRFHPAST